MPVPVEPATASKIRGGNEQSRPRISKPLQYSGSLDAYPHSDLTPVIGSEYSGLQVAEILKSEQRDQFITDLAITSTCDAYLIGTFSGLKDDMSFRILTRLSLKARCPFPAKPRCNTPTNEGIRGATDGSCGMRK